MKKEDIGHPSVSNIIQCVTDDDIVFVRKIKMQAKEAGTDLNEDMYKCFVWEQGRTVFYENPKLLENISKFRKEKKGIFPFCVSSWPKKSYLSHNVE